MKNNLEQLEEFQKAFNSPHKQEPSLLWNDEWLLRHELQVEELAEYFTACQEENKVEILDSLVDQMYVLCGTIVSHGMQHIFQEAFNRVHENNMSKLVDGKTLINEIALSYTHLRAHETN